MRVFRWAVRRFGVGGLTALVAGAAVLVCIDGFEHSRWLGGDFGWLDFCSALWARFPRLSREVLGLFLVVGCVWVAARMRDKREWLGLSSVGVQPFGVACAASLACGGLALFLGVGLEAWIAADRGLGSQGGAVELRGDWAALDGAMVRVGRLEENQVSHAQIVYTRQGRIGGMADGIEASFVDGAWNVSEGRYLEVGANGELLSGPLEILNLPAPTQLLRVADNRSLSELSIFELNRLDSSQARAWWHLRIAILFAPFAWCWGFVCRVFRASRQTPWLILLATVQVAATQLGLVLLAALGVSASGIWLAFGCAVVAPSAWAAGIIRTGRRGPIFPTG